MRIVCLLLFCAAAFGQPAGWRVTKEGGAHCQASVPADLVELAPGLVEAQDHSLWVMVAFRLGSGVLPYKDDAAIKAAGIVQVFENTNKRVFYSMGSAKTAAAQSTPTTTYYVRAEGKGGTCLGTIKFRANVSEDLAKKIALSVGPQ